MILVDTGVIFAAAARNDAYYHSCSELLGSLHLAGRRLLLPSTVAAEVGYLLMTRIGPAAEAAFVSGVAEGDFEPVGLTTMDYARVADLLADYDDLPLGLTDASVVALAERLGVTEVATTDRRHFTAVRPKHVDAFTLLPERL